MKLPPHAGLCTRPSTFPNFGDKITNWWTQPGRSLLPSLTLLQNLPVLRTLQRAPGTYICCSFWLLVQNTTSGSSAAIPRSWQQPCVFVYAIVSLSNDCSVKSLYQGWLSQMWESPVFQKLGIEWGPPCSAQKTRALRGGCRCERDVGGLLRSHSWQCTWPWRGAPRRLEKDLLFREYQQYKGKLLVGQKFPRKVGEPWHTELEGIHPLGYKINWGIEGSWEKPGLRLCPKGVWISF